MRAIFLFKRNKNILDMFHVRTIVSASPFHIKRAVLLSKMTRYDVEKQRNPNLSPKELEKFLRSRGSNFESLMEHHQQHQDYEQYVLDTFNNKGIDTKVVSKLDYTKSWIDWCDAVFPVGGDGTFLLAASRVRQNIKPVIGFNSDPKHSEGFLCLPKKYSYCIQDVLQQLEEGSFSWMFRTRVRVTVNSKEEEVNLRVPQNKRGLGTHRIENRMFLKHMSSFAKSQSALALNEVFIGECMSAQVSYFEMKLLPDGKRTRVKSSGLCVSTGTGSTSWHLSMNRLTLQSITQLLQCAGVEADPNVVASKYNNSLLFDAEAMKICYTIRDLISAGVWPSPPGLAPRGFAEAIWVRSHCQDAQLVVDGGRNISFNDGSEAFFEVNPEDALRTVVLEPSS